VGGLVVSMWSAGLLLTFVPSTDVPISISFAIDNRVLGFALIVSLLTGIVFGLAPALQASNPNLVTALKDDAARGGGGHSKSRLRNALVIAQVALSLVLLIGAALFLQSLKKAQTIDPGFNPENVLLASFDLFPNGYTPQTGRAFHQQLLQRVETLPGVEAATIARRLPLGFSGSSSTTVNIDGYEPRPNENMSIEVNNVGPNYFRAMEIPLMQGRDFTYQDTDQSQRVIIINDTMARRFWREQDPLGKQVRIGQTALTIVGVVKTGKYQTLGEDPKSFMYLSILQSYRPDVVLTVRADGDPASLLPTIREAIRAMDANLPLFEVKTLTQHMSISVFTQRIAATLLGIFGLLALLLASIGLYGVMAYSVSQRTHEIGLRMALGAQGSDVLKMIVGQGMKLALIGVALGLAGAFMVTRFLASLLHGVDSTDLVTFAGASLILIAVALVASYIPARKATKVDPMIALRYE
jgi:macrolide transport system ATP-binding/permease protein